MPKTFDPETFDIHESERQTLEVYPITEKEKIDPGVLKDVNAISETKKQGKKVFIAFIGNIFLPGLGNILLKKTKVGITLLLANIVLLGLTLSPTSMLGFLGNMAYPSFPPGAASMITIAPVKQPNVGWVTVLNPSMLPILILAIVLAFVTWVHFLYLIMQKG